MHWAGGRLGCVGASVLLLCVPNIRKNTRKAYFSIKKNIYLGFLVKNMPNRSRKWFLGALFPRKRPSSTIQNDNSLIAVEREPVPTRVINPNASCKPKQRSYRTVCTEMVSYRNVPKWKNSPLTTEVSNDFILFHKCHHVRDEIQQSFTTRNVIQNNKKNTVQKNWEYISEKS